MKFAKFNIISFITSIIITLILFSYIYYKSEIFAEGNKYDYYFKYYLVIVLIDLVSIFSIGRLPTNRTSVMGVKFQT